MFSILKFLFSVIWMHGEAIKMLTAIQLVARVFLLGLRFFLMKYKLFCLLLVAMKVFSSNFPNPLLLWHKRNNMMGGDSQIKTSVRVSFSSICFSAFVSLWSVELGSDTFGWEVGYRWGECECGNKQRPSKWPHWLAGWLLTRSAWWQQNHHTIDFCLIKTLLTSIRPNVETQMKPFEKRATSKPSQFSVSTNWKMHWNSN